MYFQKRKLSSFFLLFFVISINISKENLINSIFTNFKNNLRNLWDETIKYDDSQRDTEEIDSIDHCRDSDYKYFIHYVTGQNYTFSQFINKDNAVINIIFYFHYKL